jgi:L-ascorbate metabolism protein UlaG (beta-lactamase superfamily)
MMQPADLILVTHAHWDHFDAGKVAEASRRTAALVIGPASVIRAIRTMTPDSMRLQLEPPLARGSSPAACESARVREISVTAFRTFHSRDHNSYLVELPGFRFFHDGDNELTQRIDARALGRLDALFIGPWQGSGWVGFIEALAPARWFLMHLTNEELDLHAQGRFLPDLCDHVPEGLVALRPGESVTL